MIRGGLLNQEESPDWGEEKWQVSLRKTSIGDVPGITLQRKLSLAQEEREQCLYSLGNIWDAGTECCSEPLGELCQLGRNHSAKSEPDPNF